MPETGDVCVNHPYVPAPMQRVTSWAVEEAIAKKVCSQLDIGQGVYVLPKLSRKYCRLMRPSAHNLA